MILNHIKYVWCKKDPDNYKYVLDYFAHTVQFPTKKVGTALVLISKQGAGKNIILDFTNDYIYGISGVTVDKIEQLTGRFNSTLENKLFIVCNELSDDTNKKRKNSDVLKSLITDKKKLIERKGIDTYEIDDFANYFFLSNNLNCLRIDNDDRRYAVLELSDKRCKDTDYFKKLGKTLNQDTANHFYTYLLQRDISSFDSLKDLPKTEIKKEIQDTFISPVVHFVLSNEWNGSKIECKILYDKYKSYCESHGFQYVDSTNSFGKNIRDYVVKKESNGNTYYTRKCGV